VDTPQFQPERRAGNITLRRCRLEKPVGLPQQEITVTPARDPVRSLVRNRAVRRTKARAVIRRRRSTAIPVRLPRISPMTGRRRRTSRIRRRQMHLGQRHTIIPTRLRTSKMLRRNSTKKVARGRLSTRWKRPALVRALAVFVRLNYVG